MNTQKHDELMILAKKIQHKEEKLATIETNLLVHEHAKNELQKDIQKILIQVKKETKGQDLDAYKEALSENSDYKYLVRRLKKRRRTIEQIIRDREYVIKSLDSLKGQALDLPPGV